MPNFKYSNGAYSVDDDGDTITIGGPGGTITITDVVDAEVLALAIRKCVKLRPLLWKDDE